MADAAHKWVGHGLSRKAFPSVINISHFLAERSPAMLSLTTYQSTGGHAITEQPPLSCTSGPVVSQLSCRGEESLESLLESQRSILFNFMSFQTGVRPRT